MKDLTGQRFGKLIVLERATSNSKSGNARWTCRCDCGGIVTVIGSHLRDRHTSSCGCLKMCDALQGHSRERIYRTWRGMHQRCYNKTHDKYKWYGEKGIVICSEWHDFMAFREWALGSGYTDNLTIDRTNPDGNYCPENCRWVDMKFQANNKTNNRIVTWLNENYTVSQFAEKLHVPYHTVRNQMKLGWGIEKIVLQANGG